MPAPTQAPTVPLHRIRFFDHTPSPITALSFAPIPLPPARDPSTASANANANVKGKAREGGTAELGVLVVARENGEVEIWQYVPADEGGMGNWVLSKTLPPTLTHPTISNMALAIRDPENFHNKPYSVPRLSDLRLFTAGSDSTELTERCLETGRVLQTYPIPSPPLWSLSVSPTHQLLCMTTNSPNLHFVSIPPPLLGNTTTPLEPAPAQLLRSDALPSRTRTVSVAWGIPKLVEGDDGWTWRDSYLITGNSDSSFRRWDLPPPSAAGTLSGRVTLKSRAVVEKVNKGRKTGQKGTIVWGVGVLPDGTIVTSDSLGSVTFWDPSSMAQRQSFRSHKADGMCLVIGPGGRTVFTSGPDQRVCQFTAVPQQKGGVQWALTSTKRVHSHDVRALAIFPPYVPLAANTKIPPTPINPGLAPILASGGWDMAPVLASAAPADIMADKLKNPLAKNKNTRQRVTFEESYPRKLSAFGGERGASRISVAREARLVLGRKDRSVGVWRVLEDEGGWEKVLEMELKLRTNLISSAISEDGQWLAVSDLYETKLFRLTDIGSAVRPRRIRAFATDLASAPELKALSLGQKGCGSSALLFTPDSGRLVMALAASANVVVLELPEPDEGDKVEVARVFAPQHKLEGGRSIRRRRRQKAAHRQEEDVEMDSDASSSDSDEDEEEKKPETQPWVTGLSCSFDGQYLATSDVGGKVTVFNLDTMSLHTLLPTLPHAPIALAFAPTHPLLLIVHPSNSVQFYDLEGRRFLPPSHQVTVLNQTLRGLHASVQGAVFEPSRATPRAAKLALFAHDWLATARIDLDLVARAREPGALTSRALRRKRAREAREALEASSASPSVTTGSVASDMPLSNQPQPIRSKGQSSANDADFVKVSTDRFRAIVDVDWLGEGELMLIERPYADYVGELPPAFWTGSYGKA